MVKVAVQQNWMSGKGTKMKLHLLLPLDKTEFSHQILAQVRRLFRPDLYTVRLLHVVKPPVGFSDTLLQPASVGNDYTFYSYGTDQNAARARHPIYDSNNWEGFRKGLERDLERVAADLEADGYEVSMSVHFGQPVEEIAKVVGEERIDLLAMATHGRTGLGRLFMGSVAQDVLARLEVPVLLWRVADTSLERIAQTEEAGEARPRPMERATLDGVAGRGAVTVLRADNGDVLETKGSWRPAHPQTDLSPFHEALETGRPLLYEGVLNESNVTPEEVKTEVYLTSIGTYSGEDGTLYPLINFLVKEVPMLLTEPHNNSFRRVERS